MARRASANQLEGEDKPLSKRSAGASSSSNDRPWRNVTDSEGLPDAPDAAGLADDSDPGLQDDSEPPAGEGEAIAAGLNGTTPDEAAAAAA